VALPAFGRADPSCEFSGSMLGDGEVAPELLRPPPLGRPIRLFDNIEDADAGSLEGGRIVTFECSEGEGSCGRVLSPSLLRSSLEE
jgi:hypothetical protein